MRCWGALSFNPKSSAPDSVSESAAHQDNKYISDAWMHAQNELFAPISCEHKLFRNSRDRSTDYSVNGVVVTWLPSKE